MVQNLVSVTNLIDWWARAPLWKRGVFSGSCAGLVLFAMFTVFWWPSLGSEKPSVTVNGPAQLGDHNEQRNTIVNPPGGPSQHGDHNSQTNIINPRAAVYSTEGGVLHATREDGAHLTVVQFPVTDGPWDASARSLFEIKLKAPWDSYEIRGFPPAKMNVEIASQPEQGSLRYGTTTPPAGRIVEFHFIGKRRMDVERVAVSPQRL